MNEKHTKNYFKGRKLVIATKHEKEKVIAPILERELGVQISVSIDFDTDQFGTFTRDIKRIDNQLETARAKARAGIDLNSVDLAVSSEGSFGSHPEIPWVSSNFELVLLLDTLNNIEIRGHSRSVETNLAGQYVSSVDEAKEVAKKWGFPEHGVIVRNNKNGSVIYKGIRTDKELEKRVRQLLYGFCIFGFCIRRFFTHFSFTRKLFTHKVFAKKSIYRN